MHVLSVLQPLYYNLQTLDRPPGAPDQGTRRAAHRRLRSVHAAALHALQAKLVGPAEWGAGPILGCGHLTPAYDSARLRRL